MGNVLAEFGDWQPQAILLTHIHLDHATATGTLARIYPQLQVYVHERGAPHMLDPSRLWASASRLYGEDNMNWMWGRFEPVPQERLHALSGGERLTIGGDVFEVAYTPGHAKHHVSYLHEGTAFVGDVGGVRIEPGVPTLPPMPPPDIDVEAWHRSLELISAWQPERLGITHFGLVEDAAAQLAEVGERIDLWAQSAREQERDEWVATVEEELRRVTSPEVFDAFRQTIPIDQSYAGLRRYWDKRAEAAS